ncbi:MAG TPA: hypothetical protein VNO33_14300 [Kofleriaceae bacterium]|nr:hypothetical protein [Kofleriaceae bacterium]
MRSLPDDAQRRNERLDKAAARPAPENRKPVPSKLYKAETAAATAAAVLGMIFSSSPNVLLGAGGSIDENQLFAPGTIAPSRRGESRARDEAEPDPVDASQLVPWVKLRPEAAP